MDCARKKKSCKIRVECIYRMGHPSLKTDFTDKLKTHSMLRMGLWDLEDKAVAPVFADR